MTPPGLAGTSPQGMHELTQGLAVDGDSVLLPRRHDGLPGLRDLAQA